MSDLFLKATFNLRMRSNEKILDMILFIGSRLRMKPNLPRLKEPSDKTDKLATDYADSVVAKHFNMPFSILTSDQFCAEVFSSDAIYEAFLAGHAHQSKIKDRVIDELRNALIYTKKLVDKQAEDEGLWFINVYVSEAYVQQALRKLHFSVESNFKAIASTSKLLEFGEGKG